MSHTERFQSRILASLLALLTAVSIFFTAGATEVEQLDPQVIQIVDSRSGDGPCGFEVQRDIAGEIEVTASIDDTGALVLSIEPVNLQGTLTNPANGTSVALKWIRQNDMVTFTVNGSSTDVSLPLTGYFMRGYDTADSNLEMNLPTNGSELVEFVPGQRSEEPWAHVCGLLS